ncbi:MAG TPA: ABC-type transport auxiliary lipoprotein family protein [Bryobacteraceae bacterium]|nr:ABC-type transport auxiliary lipoprotein family protein [Bryobacteraceae bacterium]
MKRGGSPHLLASALLGLLLLSACGKVRYPTNYILNFPRPASPVVAPDAAFGPVVINEFRCLEYLCQGRIVYRPRPEEIGFYEYHRWAMDPRQSITQLMADTLRARSIFKHAAMQGRGIEADYILNGGIERLEEVDEGRDVRVECAISAQLIDTRTGAIVWSGAASQTIPVGKRDVAGVVVALTTAAQTVVDRLVKSMTDQLMSTR